MIGVASWIELANTFNGKQQLLIDFFDFISQLAQLLPMEENFLLLFRFDNPLDSSVEFMKVFDILRNFSLIRPCESKFNLNELYIYIYIYIYII